MSTKEMLAERKLNRMRLGQAVCEFVEIPSDEEVKFAIVPLTEAEYVQALEAVAEMKTNDNLAGAQLQDRRRAQEILIRSIREPDDLSKRIFADVHELMEAVDVGDVDELIDRYNEMVATGSPAIDEIDREEFENLKVLLQEMNWNALSGSAWYAAKRFLSQILPQPLLGNSPGSTQISKLTTRSE
jgi:hypothetical protein